MKCENCSNEATGLKGLCFECECVAWDKKRKTIKIIRDNNGFTAIGGTKAINVKMRDNFVLLKFYESGINIRQRLVKTIDLIEIMMKGGII